MGHKKEHTPEPSKKGLDNTEREERVLNLKMKEFRKIAKLMGLKFNKDRVK